MEIDNRISAINQTVEQLYNSKDIKTKTTGSIFEDFYKAAIELYGETNTLQHKADNLQIDYLTGKTDDMISVTMAMEKATTSLNFTVQVTNKIIEAYREIMRLQV